jgi:hypothetical protein
MFTDISEEHGASLFKAQEHIHSIVEVSVTPEALTAVGH